MLVVLFAAFQVQVRYLCCANHQAACLPFYYSGTSTASSLVHLIDLFWGGPLFRKRPGESHARRGGVGACRNGRQSWPRAAVPSKWPFHGCEDESEPLLWDNAVTNACSGSKSWWDSAVLELEGARAFCLSFFSFLIAPGGPN